MIDVYGFAPCWGINASPFVYKVETYLRLAGLPFRSVATVPFKAPKGKLPYIVDGGQVVADSGLILAHLQQTHGVALDDGLSGEQWALAHLLRRTCEESLYWAMMYGRWIEPEGWAVISKAFFAAMPAPLRAFVPALVRRGMRRQLQAQGYGRHSRAEVYRLGCDDLTAIATCLRRTAFAVADHPTSVDAGLYAFLSNLDRQPIRNPLQETLQADPALTGYLRRMDERLRLPT